MRGKLLRAPVLLRAQCASKSAGLTSPVRCEFSGRSLRAEVVIEGVRAQGTWYEHEEERVVRDSDSDRRTTTREETQRQTDCKTHGEIPTTGGHSPSVSTFHSSSLACTKHECLSSSWANHRLPIEW